jgi:hypothetical protein
MHTDFTSHELRVEYQLSEIHDIVLLLLPRRSLQLGGVQWWCSAALSCVGAPVIGVRLFARRHVLQLAARLNRCVGERDSPHARQTRSHRQKWEHKARASASVRAAE